MEVIAFFKLSPSFSPSIVVLQLGVLRNMLQSTAQTKLESKSVSHIHGYIQYLNIISNV